MTDYGSILADYPHRLSPFSQQRAALSASISKRFFALLMDTGTGKTKVAIDTAAIHYRLGNINAVLIAAPNDVHLQWIIEQIPEHMPRDIKVRMRAWAASSAKALRECLELVTHPLPDCLTIVAMNHEAFATTKGVNYAKRFLKLYKSLLIIDESDLAIKNHKAARARAFINTLGPLAVMRRILTGTPAETPFDLYAQMRFLHDDILGYTKFIPYKHRYATWTKNFTTSPKVNAKGQRPVIEYETLEGYQNLDELHARTAPYIYRIRKEECMDLPPKLYSRRFVSLSPAQRKVYDELKENSLLLLKAVEERPQVKPVDVLPLLELSEDELLARTTSPEGRTTTAIKLTLFLRLQQVVGGFITDDAAVTRSIDGTELNPRMLALLRDVELAAKQPYKILIWAMFRKELEHIAQCIKALGLDCEAIYGQTHSRSDKADAIARFKDPASKLTVLVTHEQSLGTGMNFVTARNVFYYSSGASARKRKQSEDRCHRIGQNGTVSVIDYDAHEVQIDKRMREFREEKADFNTSIMTWRATDLRTLL